MDLFPDARFETYPDEATWLAARRTGLGSSDAAAILGASRHSDAYEVFCDKHSIPLPAPDPASQDLMAWGRSLEAPILEQFEARSGWEVHRPPRLSGYISLPFPWLRASLDAVVFRPDRSDPGPIEVKWAPYLDPDDAQRPDYLVQNLHQQVSLGALWGTVVVLARTELVWFDVEPDPDFFDQYIHYTRDFWVKVLKGEAPDPDGSDRTRKVIAARFQQPTPGLITALSQDALLWDHERQHALEEVKKWRGMADQYEARLKDAIGEAEAGVLDDGTTYTWCVQKRAGYVVAPTEFRQLRRRQGPLDLSALIETLGKETQ